MKTKKIFLIFMMARISKLVIIIQLNMNVLIITSVKIKSALSAGKED